MKKIFIFLILSFVVCVTYAQGDYNLQTKGNVSVTWRLVSDFQSEGAECWGWTYHIFISNGNNYPITLKSNSAYQNNGDYSSCWEAGSIDLSDELIPTDRWREFTFRVTTGKGGKPGSPGLKYNIDWTSNYKELQID